MADRVSPGRPPPACTPRRHDIVSKRFHDNDTYYECRICGSVWLGLAQPGLLHHYVTCISCRRRLDLED